MMLAFIIKKPQRRSVLIHAFREEQACTSKIILFYLYIFFFNLIREPNKREGRLLILQLMQNA